MLEPLLTVDDIARILNVSRATAKCMTSRRAFPVVKVGRLVRVRRAELEAWISQNEISAVQKERLGSRASRSEKASPGADFEQLIQDLKAEGDRR